MTGSRILVVEDDPLIGRVLIESLTSHGFETVTLIDVASDAVQQYETARPAAVVLDLCGQLNGLGLLTTFKNIDPDVPILVLANQRRSRLAVRAIKLGATEALGKPLNALDLQISLAQALRQCQRLHKAAELHDPWQTDGRSPLLGHNPMMAEVRELIERVARTDVTVLVRGESGTGKEIVARALHGASLRRGKPFIKVNCAALPTELLESELFGFERGAFTGALQAKPGKFEFAHHGTMFLDEIGETTPPLQAKLLQVLQDGEFSRLGGKGDVRVDVRIVTATNRDLERAVDEGQFREDLFFRLNVVCITLPPLRERKDDIQLLTQHLLKKYSAHYDRPLPELSAETTQLFMDYDWPGNVRELENAIQRFVVLGSEYPIQTGFSQPRSPRPMTTPVVPQSGAPEPPPAVPPAPENVSLKKVGRTAARAAERELIVKMLQRTRWNRKEAAGILGISYKALLYKIKEIQLDDTA